MITIDDREPVTHGSYVAGIKNALGAQNVHIERLLFADYAFDAHPDLNHAWTGAHSEYDGIANVPCRVGIEVSSVSDVIGKMDSGRLEFQLSGMLERYNVSILLIESPIRVDVNGCILVPGSPYTPKYSRLESILFGAQAHGVIVNYAQDKASVVDSIVRIYNYYNRPLNSHKTFRPQRLVPQVKIPLGEAIDARTQNLMTLPGIGEDKALRLLQRYGRLDIIYGLPEIGFSQVPGIGRNIAGRVYDFITKPISKPLDVDAAASQLSTEEIDAIAH